MKAPIAETATAPAGNRDVVAIRDIDPGAFVVTSRLRVCSGGALGLEAAFRNRLGAVDAWPGFLALQVWRDARAPGEYVLVTWWTSPEDYRAYMRSEDHSASHARIPSGEHAPAPIVVHRFEVVGT